MTFHEDHLKRYAAAKAAEAAKKLAAPPWSQWTSNPSEGLVVGADAAQEWLLPWWWERYRKANDRPVAFADFGMTPQARDWCGKHGVILDCRLVGIRGWWHKPFAVLRAPWQRILWLDADCEVRASLDPIFAFVPSGKIGVVFDSPAVNFPNHLTPGARIYNSGTVLVDHGEPVIAEWATRTHSERSRWPGDQDLLSQIVFETARERAVELPVSLVSLYSQGRYKSPIVHHWTGPGGKNIIRGQRRNS
jgi:hypothetical protein